MKRRISKCRFLDEYANFKRSYYKDHSDDGCCNQEYARQAVEKLDTIVRNWHHGLMTIDEAMKSISEI